MKHANDIKNPPIKFEPYQVGNEIGYVLSVTCPRTVDSPNWEDYLFTLGRIAHRADDQIWRGVTHKTGQEEICCSFENARDFVVIEGVAEWLADRRQQQATSTGKKHKQLVHQRTWLELLVQTAMAVWDPLTDSID